MGYAIARAARELGAEVVLISGPTSFPPPGGVRLIGIESTDDLLRAVEREFDSCDCLIMAAAPADFTPADPSSQKIKKSGNDLSLSLKPTVDILRRIGGRRRPGQLLVGFALETENGVENARRKLEEKRLDLIVLNDLRDDGAGFDVDTNRVTVISAEGESIPLNLASKERISEQLLEIVASKFYR